MRKLHNAAKKNGFTNHEHRYERDIYYQLGCRAKGIGPVLLDMFGESPIDSRNKQAHDQGLPSPYSDHAVFPLLYRDRNTNKLMRGRLEVTHASPAAASGTRSTSSSNTGHHQSPYLSGDVVDTRRRRSSDWPREQNRWSASWSSWSSWDDSRHSWS